MGKRKSETDEDTLKRKKKKCKIMPPPPVPGSRMDRTFSCVSEISMSQVSPKVRETLLTMERVKIRDPFSLENQEIIQEFRESAMNTALEDMNLTEMALLLRGVMSLWKRQVGCCITDISKLAAFVTNTEEKLPDGIDNPSTCEPGNEGEPIEQTKENEALENNGVQNPENKEVELTETEKTLQGNAELNGDPLSEADQKASEENPNAESEPIASGEDNKIDNENDVQLVSALGDDQNGISGNPLDSSQLPPSDLICEVSKEAELAPKEPKPIKPRKEKLPPILLPWFDIPLTQWTSEDEDDTPPLLTREDIYERKKRIRKIKPPPTEDNNNADSSVALGPEIASCSNNTENIVKDSESTTQEPLPSMLTEGLSKLHQTEFSPDDIAEIQLGITQLHYLPFTCELTNEEIKKAFQNLLNRLSTIFEKYGVSLNTHFIKLAGSKTMGSTYHELFKYLLQGVGESTLSQSSGESVPLQIIEESQSLQLTGEIQSNSGAETMSTQEESELTVLEMTPEPTLAMSQVRMREMIMEMQKSIVPKYARIPLMVENTAEFFQRVKIFEEKMKIVLEKEARKETFDVRKYEMHVLDAANKEIQDSDISDDGSDVESMSPNSPFTTPEKLIGFNDNFLSPCFNGLPSPSSSDGSDSQRWISLTQLFTHMKKMEKPEAARVFYAMLALLSFRNLDIKYENHFSAASAALISKSFDHSQDSKYPRGLKIMSSRCPDTDMEEIFIAPLSSQSRTNIFRQLEQGSVEGISCFGNRRLSDSSSSSREEVVNGDLTHDIDSEFVKSECSVYSGALLSLAKSRRINKPPPIKRKPKPLEFSKLAPQPTLLEP